MNVGQRIEVLQGLDPNTPMFTVDTCEYCTTCSEPIDKCMGEWPKSAFLIIGSGQAATEAAIQTGTPNPGNP